MPINSEIKFGKEDWNISIKTTAHGTRISIILESPENEIGFISHLFSMKDKSYNKTDRSHKSVENRIKYNSNCLRKYGESILSGDPLELKRILDLLICEQEKWIEKSGIANTNK